MSKSSERNVSDDSKKVKTEKVNNNSKEKNNVIIVPVPKQIIPITKIGTTDIDFTQKPFFGYAPSETPTRISLCPNCHRPISVSHLNLHLKSHDEEKIPPPKPISTFHPPSNSKLLSQTPCTYSNRQNYTFRILFDEK